MSTLLLVCRGEVALQRDVAADLARDLRALGHTLRCTWEQEGIAGGWISALEADAAAVDRVLLVDPARWWRPGPVADEWQRSVGRLVEHATGAAVDHFAVAITEAAGDLEQPLDRLPSFELAAAWDGLVEWLARPRAPFVLAQEDRLPPRAQQLLWHELALGEIDRHVAAGLGGRGDLVWIRGAAGTGKTELLLEWLRRRASDGVELIHHVARPGIAWSHDPEQVLDKLVRALLGPEFAGSPERALARLRERGKRAVVAIDGLERIAARLEAIEPERRDRLRGLFVDGLPRGVVVLATSRALAPGTLAREPTIDLDAEPWCSRRREAQSEEPTRDLTPEIAVDLERSWTAMLARSGSRGSALRSGLAIMTAARDALPIALVHAALTEDERELLQREACEWVQQADGRVGFVHPFVRRFLESELDALDPRPHVRLLDALASMHARGLADPGTTDYASKHARDHRLACHGFDAGLAWILDVDLLVALAQRDSLVARLEAALDVADSQRRWLVERTLAVARRRRTEFVKNGDALPTYLWTELVGGGMQVTQVEELLNWGTHLPPIRLSSAIDYRERHYLQLEHDGDVRGCAIDAHAQRAISVTTQRSAHVWAVRTGELLAKLDVGVWAESCAISADGRRAAVGAGRRVSVWDLDGKTELAHHDHDDDVMTVSMSADGSMVLSADRNGAVVSWQVDRDRRIKLRRHGATVRCSAMSGDGRLALTGDDDRRVQVWDIERRELVQTLTGHTYAVGGVALTWTGELGISICIGEARVWEPRSGRSIAKHDDLGESTRGCVLVEGPSGAGLEALVAESGQEVHRWTVADGERRARHFAHAQDMLCIAATPDGQWYVTGGRDQLARVWHAPSMVGVGDDSVAGSITALCASAEEHGVWVSGGGEGVRLVSTIDGRVLERIERSGVQAIAEAGDRVVTGGGDRQIEVYSRSRQSDLVTRLEPTKDWIRACAVDPGASRLAYGGDDKVVVCSDFGGDNVVRLAGHGDWVRALAFTLDGRLVSVGDDGELRIWDVAEGECLRECRPFDDAALCALAVDGQRAYVGGVAGKIAMVDLRSGETLTTFMAHSATVNGLALTERGLLVSVGRDATLKIWSVDDTQGRMLVGYEGVYPFTCVAAEGRELVVGDSAGNHLVLTVDWERIAGS